MEPIAYFNLFTSNRVYCVVGYILIVFGYKCNVHQSLG